METGMFQASAVAKVGDCVDVTKSDFKFDVKVRFPIISLKIELFIKK